MHIILNIILKICILKEYIINNLIPTITNFIFLKFSIFKHNYKKLIFDRENSFYIQ